MSRIIVISSVLDQVLVGIIDDGHLIEFFLEQDEQSRVVGNIYKGKVENVLPGMSAAFVDIGLDRNAFLYVDDISSQTGNKRITDLVHKGQEILVQVTKEPEGAKGCRIIERISLPGRFLVLMPTESNIGVSRQISDPIERERLKQIANELQVEGMGLIIRTVASGEALEDLRDDVVRLKKQWDRIEQNAKTMSAPALVYQDHDLVYRIVRDFVTRQVDEIVVDQVELYESVREMVSCLMQSNQTEVTLYRGKVGLLEQFGVLRDLEHATKKRVWLDSGGYLILDPTEALMSIDVNTGKYVGVDDLRETVLKTNLEAAGEIGKQLRLRNVGGIIIIDFIDMDRDEDRRKVIHALEVALAKDKTKSHVLGFTQLGLVEMTRKKSKKTLSHMLEVQCYHCWGTGRILSASIVALRVAHQIQSVAKESDIVEVKVECHPAVAAILIGSEGATLARLKKETKKVIQVAGNDGFTLTEANVVGV